MKNVKLVLDWIDRNLMDPSAGPDTDPAPVADLIEILDMTALVPDGDDIPPQCPDGTSYRPYLDGPRDAAVTSYLFGIFDTLPGRLKKRTSIVINRRAGWQMPPGMVAIILRHHRAALADELVRNFASWPTFSTALGELMRETGIVKKEWVEILRNAPNRFLPLDPVEEKAYPGLREYREKADRHLEELLTVLRTRDASYRTFKLGGDRAEACFTDLEPLGPPFPSFDEAKDHFDRNRPGWTFRTDHEYSERPDILLVENRLAYYTDETGNRKNPVLMNRGPRSGQAMIEAEEDGFSWTIAEPS